MNELIYGVWAVIGIWLVLDIGFDAVYNWTNKESHHGTNTKEEQE